MPAKLSFVVLSMGIIACSLLALRQSRLQVASELTQSQLRINSADEKLWTLRARIAERISPSEIEQMARALGPLGPVTEAPSPEQIIAGERLAALDAPAPPTPNARHAAGTRRRTQAREVGR